MVCQQCSAMSRAYGIVTRVPSRRYVEKIEDPCCADLTRIRCEVAFLTTFLSSILLRNQSRLSLFFYGDIDVVGR